MGDVTRVLSGLGEFEVTAAVETAGGGLEVSVRVARADAPCPRCGTFSSRVKEYRTQRVRDGLSYERATTLVWTKRRFRCATPGCVSSFTESTAEVPRRRRVTARLCAAIAREVRCRRQQELTGHRGRKGDPLWAVRRDLLRARHHLTAAAWERLDAAFRADCWDELECAWTLKEMLGDLYGCADRAAAEAALADWHHHAGAFDVAETNRLARTLRAWQPELLAYFDGRLTNGPTEGTNRIIKAVKRQGFGYTNAQNYRWRVLYRCA